VFQRGAFLETEEIQRLNVLIRDKILFVGVAHLTRGVRSCSWRCIATEENVLMRQSGVAMANIGSD